MKKLKITISMLLSIILLISSLGFAAEKEVTYKLKKHDGDFEINLVLSNSEEDLEILSEEKLKIGNAKHFGLISTEELRDCDNGMINITMNKIDDSESGIIVDGNGVIILNSMKYSFSFEDIEFRKNISSTDEKIFDGVIISTVMDKDNNKTDIVIDLFFSENECDKGTATVTVGSFNDDLAMLFFGKTFNSQIEIMNNYKNNQYNEISNNEEENSYSEMSILSGESFRYAGCNASKYLDGSMTSYEMVVLNAYSLDPRDVGDLTGRERIRVFSRSYNVTKTSPSILLSEARNVEIKFSWDACNKAELTNIYPTTSTTNYNSGLIDLFSSLYPTAGTYLNAINVAFSMISNTSTMSNTNGDNYNNYGKKILYSIDDADLQESTSSSLAYTNDDDGVIAEFKYDSIYTGGYWTVVDKARILYRTYLNTNRTSSVWSGYAEKSHTVYGK